MVNFMDSNLELRVMVMGCDGWSGQWLWVAMVGVADGCGL